MKKLLVAALVMFSLASPARAEDLHMKYILYAGGLKVVDVNVNYSLSPSDYSIQANAQTRGMWKSLVPWRNMIVARGGVDENGIHPRIARYDTAWREKMKTIEMAFAADGTVTTKSTPPQRLSGRVEATPEQINGTMDPLSAVVNVLARGTQGCQGKIPAFDGRRVYNLVLTNKGAENLEKTDYSIFAGTATRCEVTFEPVAGFPQKEERAGFWSAKDNADKGNPLVIWIAKMRDDLPLLPVRVQSTVQLGTLVAHLQSIQ